MPARRLFLALLFFLVAVAPVTAEEVEADPPLEAPMTFQRLTEIARGLDPEARIAGTQLQITISDVPVIIVADPGADRMRAMVPIRGTAGMTPAELMRAMQANFDTVLDSRYAVAQGRLWAVFIHPLSPLERDQLISGLGQTVNAALTYGSSYTSGALTYGGGDAAAAERALIEELLKRGEDI